MRVLALQGARYPRAQRRDPRAEHLLPDIPDAMATGEMSPAAHQDHDHQLEQEEEVVEEAIREA